MTMRLLLLSACCVTGTLWAEDPMGQPMGQEPGVVFDPFRGMDQNGRIPKIDYPADIQHPERWRYIPEGRIKPGSMVERFWVTSFVTPIVFYEEDVGLGGGVAITDIDFRQTRRQEFAGIFLSTTTEGQERYKVVWQRWLNHRPCLVKSFGFTGIHIRWTLMPPRLCSAVRLPGVSLTISSPAAPNKTRMPDAAVQDAEMSGRSISAVWKSRPATRSSPRRKRTG